MEDPDLHPSWKARIEARMDQKSKLNTFQGDKKIVVIVYCCYFINKLNVLYFLYKFYYFNII